MISASLEVIWEMPAIIFEGAGKDRFNDKFGQQTEEIAVQRANQG